ncbi:hypothetical protein [Mastigocladopsis repens]|uniref:hypothetical protein n=1 Tax=Mastigocladopsis repens TaxID=221287 RepID=UPI0003045FFC|nr:hypothetical protein [Mastigocladopsis repens]
MAALVSPFFQQAVVVEPLRMAYIAIRLLIRLFVGAIASVETLQWNVSTPIGWAQKPLLER